MAEVPPPVIVCMTDTEPEPEISAAEIVLDLQSLQQAVASVPSEVIPQRLASPRPTRVPHTSCGRRQSLSRSCTSSAPRPSSPAIRDSYVCGVVCVAGERACTLPPTASALFGRFDGLGEFDLVHPCVPRPVAPGGSAQSAAPKTNLPHRAPTIDAAVSGLDQGCHGADLRGLHERRAAVTPRRTRSSTPAMIWRILAVSGQKDPRKWTSSVCWVAAYRAVASVARSTATSW
jgi:hypothetical protein